MSDQDYYRLLGVSKEAPEREIKQKYYEHARKLHPDKAGSPAEAEQNAKLLAQLSMAYNTLKDPKKRADYDAKNKGKSPAGSPPPGSSGMPPAAAAPSATPSAPGSTKPTDQVTTVKLDTSAQKKNMAQKAFVKGMQLYKVQNFKDAKGFFEVAVNNDPEGEAQYHLKYAQTLMKIRSSFSKAVQHAEKACEMEPYNVEFKLVLGNLNESAGVLSRAKAIYEDVLKWDPENEAAKQRLAFLAGDSGKKGSFLDKLKAKLNGKK